ncbi:PH domain-containing protein [Streptomyces sp. NBC_01465]|uniref:PH domain-containing protein n=1 Tax=Streptomyces sp. NBC_01465 TaxID=2903878 RepID=UPI002E2EACB3|nr:PH domain-containing protein [Streptomyces sp. NBC_01465]
MAGNDEFTLRYGGATARWIHALAGLVAVGAGAAAGLGAPDGSQWSAYAVVIGGTAVGSAFGFLLRRVEAGPDGLRYRTVLRWHRLEWDEIVRLESIQVMPRDKRRKVPNLRVDVRLRNGEEVRLPLPWAGQADPYAFEDQMRRLHAVRRRYTPAL